LKWNNKDTNEFEALQDITVDTYVGEQLILISDVLDALKNLYGRGKVSMVSWVNQESGRWAVGNVWNTAYQININKVNEYGYGAGCAGIALESTNYFEFYFCASEGLFVYLPDFLKALGLKSDALVIIKKADTPIYKIIGGVACEYSDKKGFVKIPGANPLFNTYGHEAGVNWLTEKAMASVIKIATQWETAYLSWPRIQIGDGSTEDGHKTSRHEGHLDGKRVDVRPIRNDNLMIGTNIGLGTYSQKGTENLIKVILQDNNVSGIKFNDSDLIKKYGRVTWYTGHNDHIHIDFSY